jgi:hypothetical protein
MTFVFKWGVRNLSIALGLVGLAAGFAGVLDWALALAAAGACAFLAKTAAILVRARERRLAREAVVKELEAARARPRALVLRRYEDRMRGNRAA